jgi:ferredoxin/flavodoxin---NADP+ reductase
MSQNIPTVSPSEAHLQESPADTDKGGRKARVAVVGAGPSGIYAVESLLESVQGLGVDVFDRLPTPYGLVRYGIAPDNQKMKSVTRVLRNALHQRTNVRFIGNVRFGADINRADLIKHYDAVIYATGAQDERRLGISGEGLPGSYGAKEFVDWYNGHPDAADRHFPLQAKQVAVVGAGNVALDVARMLILSPGEIASTDVPDRVLYAFSNSQITDVHLIGRRGPAQAKFTPAELRGIGDLINADVVIRPDELLLTEDDEVRISSNRELRTNITMLRQWALRPLQGRARRLHIRFLRRPVRILGENRVEGILIESNEQLAQEQVRGTGNFETLKVDMIFRSVGYRALRLPDVPFDETRSIIPHDRGRVLDAGGQTAAREYVTGWAKRGPTGTVGTNRSDSAETVCGLLEDLVAQRSYGGSDPAKILDLLKERRVKYTDWGHWLRLDDYETQLGRDQGRPRVKIPDLRSMLELSHHFDASGRAGD